jgi:hypothetical protein
MERTTGAVHTRWAGGRAHLYLLSGSLVHAESEAASGLAVALEALAHDRPELQMEIELWGGVPPPASTIDAPMTALLLDAARLRDEIGREEPAVDPDAGELDRAFAALAEPALGSGPIPRPPPWPQAAGHAAVLADCCALDGVIGAAVVELAAGRAVAAAGSGCRPGLAIAHEASAFAEVARAHAAAAERGDAGEIQDVVITQGRRHHLLRFLSPQRERFLYLALERGRANLALARIRAADLAHRLAPA